MCCSRRPKREPASLSCARTDSESAVRPPSQSQPRTLSDAGHRRRPPDSDSVRWTVRQIMSATYTGGHKMVRVGHDLADSLPDGIGVLRTPPMSTADKFVSVVDFDLVDTGGVRICPRGQVSAVATDRTGAPRKKRWLQLQPLAGHTFYSFVVVWCKQPAHMVA